MASELAHDMLQQLQERARKMGRKKARGGSRGIKSWDERKFRPKTSDQQSSGRDWGSGVSRRWPVTEWIRSQTKTSTVKDTQKIILICFFFRCIFTAQFRPKYVRKSRRSDGRTMLRSAIYAVSASTSTYGIV